MCIFTGNPGGGGVFASGSTVKHWSVTLFDARSVPSACKLHIWVGSPALQNVLLETEDLCGPNTPAFTHRTNGRRQQNLEALRQHIN